MKKIISLVLVAALALSMMVMTVSAAETTDGVTRAEWAEEIVKAAGGVPAGAEKADLADTAEASDAVKYLIAEGVILGYKDGNFKGEQVATVEEAVAMVARAVEAKVLNVAKVSEAGEANAEASEYAQEAFAAVANCGIEVADAAKTELSAELAAKIIPAITTKFYFGVKSGEGYVTVHVNGDYEMAISVADQKVNAGEISLEAAMINVGSLEVSGKKSHSVTVSTGLTGDPDLKVWLQNCWKFEGSTVNVDVDGKACVYNVQPVAQVGGDAVIVFAPADVAATRAAWQALTANVSVSSQDQDDSCIFIAPNSELAIGEENLVFENESNGLKLDGFNNIDALKQAIRDNVKMGDGYEGSEDVKVLVGAGTQLAVGQTVATLDKDCSVVVSGVEMGDCSILSDLRDAESTYAMAETLVKLVDKLVGELNGKTVDVVVSFGAIAE